MNFKPNSSVQSASARRAGIALVAGLIILLFTWLALQPAGRGQALGNDGDQPGLDLPYQEPATDTPTSTATETATPTETVTPTPTSTSTATATETLTPTASSTATETHTPTVTGTPPTLTPTFTSTPTFTPTVTGTPPTPTPTGTLTPNINITLSVTPGEARKGERFTFRIIITNTGTAPVTNVLVTDTFSSFLDISGAATTQGTVTTNAAARTVNVNIGTINPNQTVTITILMTVNNSVTVTTTQAHASIMVYVYGGVTFSRSSNAVAYRIVVGSTLPPTGWMELDGTPDANGVYLPAIISGAVFFLLGILALVAGGRNRKSGNTWGGWLTRMGLILLAAGVLFALGGFMLNGTRTASPQSGLVDAYSTPTGEIIHFSLTPEAAIIPWPDKLEKLPDYPIPSPTFALTPDENGELPDASAATRLIIPAVGVDNVIKYVPFDGESWMIAGLREEIAWMGETSWPGLGSNTGLAGHVTLRDGSDGPFRNLSEIQVGDEVLVYTEEKIYSYQVTEFRLVDEAEMAVIDPSEKSQVTLITCTDWNKELKMYMKRLVVFAELVEDRPIHASQ
jgi:LPXTG-site transpeptidase (sortase) family protein